MSLQTSKVYKSIIHNDVETIVMDICDFMYSGGDVNIRDSVTGETYMHHIVTHIDKFKDARGVTLLYLLACKPIDLDAQDCDGETVLHRVVRRQGAYRAMVALVRCGASMDIKNKEGHTPEDILLLEKPDGWQVMLHWYRKFKPGLWAALSAPNPDKRVVERLLKSWCRLTVFRKGKVTNMKCLAHCKSGQLDIVYLLEKYENTIEFALATLAAVPQLCSRWRELGFDVKSVDINTKDHSHQVSYPDHPEVPQPLFAAVLEKDMYEVLDTVMSFGPDINVLYGPIPDPNTSPAPLFFQLCSTKTTDDRIIHRVLKACDITARGRHGGTILMEAIINDCSDQLVTALFQNGVNVASRARCGRTSRDIAQVYGKPKYVQLIDDHVIDLVKSCNIERVEGLILQGYDHLLDITDEKGRNALQLARQHGSKQLVTILQNTLATQDHAKKLFLAADKGNKSVIKKLLTKKYACALDRCSRTLLHHAILHRHPDLVRSLLEEYPVLVNKSDCMGRTPLHYAKLFLDKDDTIEYLLKKGASKDAKDTEGCCPKWYSRSETSPHEYRVRQKQVEDFDLEIFLGLTNFFDTFYHACQIGDLSTVKNLTLGLKEHNAQHRFSNALFDCVDHRQNQVAEYLIKNGFSTDVRKQYEKCNPDDPMCAMMECGHTSTSLRQRALDLGSKDIVKLIDVAGKLKGKVKISNNDVIYKCPLGKT